MSISLCNTTDIADPGSKSIEINIDGTVTHLFIVHKDGKFHAFINSCPHTGANLDWLENQFLDMDNVFIQCATHDALFEISSGMCVAGPCIGKKLTPFDISIRGSTIFSSTPDFD